MIALDQLLNGPAIKFSCPEGNDPIRQGNDFAVYNSQTLNSFRSGYMKFMDPSGRIHFYIVFEFLQQMFLHIVSSAKGTNRDSCFIWNDRRQVTQNINNTNVDIRSSLGKFVMIQ